MNQRFLLLMITFFPFFAFAQGIQWAKDLSWEQVKQKAKKENKFIFVDVYATWCPPCKVMDREVYPLKQVGELYNEKFISIKVQTNKTQNDPDDVKRWYADAMKIESEHNVKSYPTFLFFNPRGELVHRASGGFNAEKFLGLANDALQQKGYVPLIEKFKKGQYENLDLKELAFSAKYTGDDSLAKAIATLYIQSLDVNKLLKQENLVFVFKFGEQDKKWAREVCMPKISKLSIDQLANVQAIRFLLYAAKNDSLASKAADFWINGMTDKQIFNKDTLEYIKLFVRHSIDKGFVVLFKNAVRVNKIMGKKDWATDALRYVILKEEFMLPIYSPAAKITENSSDKKMLIDPDWKKLNGIIRSKYGAKYARSLQFSPKISWYGLTGNKKEYIKYLVAEMDRTKGFGFNMLALNNTSMEVFRYSTNRKDIRKAAIWMRRYYKENPKEVNTDAAGLDTYAILLYKAGKVKESIKWEEKAAKISANNSEIADNLSKMKKGLPIWPVGFDVVK